MGETNSSQNQGQDWTKENLADALQTAIAVEMFTIPVYLSAATSIVMENRFDKQISVTLEENEPDTEPAAEMFSAYEVIMSVAVQEMFHLTMACNLANALGVRPNLQAPDLDNPPSCLGKIAGMPVRGDLSTLIDTMLAIEAPDPQYHYPESPTEDPTQFPGPTKYQESYESIGDLYHALAFGVKAMWDTMYSDDNKPYQKINFQTKYPEVNAVITTLQEAYNAISCITEQGEGNGSEQGFMPADYVPATNQQYQELDEVDHWKRFNDIKEFFNNGGTIPQYSVQAHSSAASGLKDAAQKAVNKATGSSDANDNLNNTYTLLMTQLNAAFKSTDALNLRGMADTGTLATAVWADGGVPQWDYISDPNPWPAPSKHPHSCQGLNACKNQGYSNNNDCAGAGTCATCIEHACQYTNACAGQGGCGFPGKTKKVDGAPIYWPRVNDCSQLGGCQAPISPLQYYNEGEYSGQKVWDVAREKWKAAYEKANPDKTLKPVGPDTDRRKGLMPTSPKGG